MRAFKFIFFFFIISLPLNSCKNHEFNGIYKHGRDSLDIMLRNNSYIFFAYRLYNRNKDAHIDVFNFFQVCILKGSFKIMKDRLILYDSIKHVNYNFTILNNDSLICNSSFYCYKPRDTIYCREKFYHNGRTKWEIMPFDEKKYTKIYYDRKGISTKIIYYDNKKKNIIKIEKTDDYKKFYDK